MNFLTKGTKIKCIVASVIVALALITLIMLSTLITFTQQNTRLTMCLIYSVTLLLTLLITKGIIDICVFKDYKSQSKILCSEGVLNITMGSLLVITTILYGILGNELIRWFLASFIFIMAIWKLTEMILAIKNKHFDFIIDIISFSLWFISSGLLVSSLYINVDWIIVGLSWVLIAINILNLLISYVIKTPTYLETEEAIRIKKEQLEEAELAKEKERLIIKGKNAKANLEQLKQLFEKNLITQADYNFKKKEILGIMFNEESK